MKFCVYAIARNEADFMIRFCGSAYDSEHIVIADTSSLALTERQTYRQSLRDITEQTGFPENIEWPEIPGTESEKPV